MKMRFDESDDIGQLEGDVVRRDELRDCECAAGQQRDSPRLAQAAADQARHLDLVFDYQHSLGFKFAGFDISTWFGIFAPAGTPREAVARLHAEFTRALAAPDVREKMLNLGAEPVVVDVPVDPRDEDLEAVQLSDADAYCQRFANAAFHCRSTGGGNDNRKVCLP